MIFLTFGAHPIESRGFLCSNCPPGQGIVKLCTKSHSTVCEPCLQGTFKENYVNKPCSVCKSCKEGYFIKSQCSPTQDTQCASCKDYLNEFKSADYSEKCTNLVTQVSPRNNELGVPKHKSSTENKNTKVYQQSTKDLNTFKKEAVYVGSGDTLDADVHGSGDLHADVGSGEDVVLFRNETNGSKNGKSD